MATPSLPQPIETDPTRIVEDTYARKPRWSELLRPDEPEHESVPLDQMDLRDRFLLWWEQRFGADRRTQAEIEVFLVDRMIPTPASRKGVVRVQDGFDRSVTWDAGLHWLGGNWKRHLVVAASVFVIGNAIANGSPLARAITNYFFPPEPSHRVEWVKEDHKAFQTQGNQVAQTEPDMEIVNLAVDEIRSALARGAEVTSISIEGTASDEYGRYGDAALGRVDQENVALAQARADRDAAALQGELARIGITGVSIESKASERVLIADEFTQLDVLRRNAGFESITAADRAFRADPTSVPPELAAALSVLEQNRGAQITIATVEKVPVTITRPPGKQDGGPFRVIPILLPPIPLIRRRVSKTPRFVDVETGSDLAEFVKLYPAALRGDRTLVENAWQYTRKYQNLLREQHRIKHTVRLDYVDFDDQPQTLRAVFVDHEPSPAELAMVEDSLKTISLARGGSIGEDLDMIAIYPARNAGFHGDPKRVGLGLDLQKEAFVLGVAIPALGIVEMHLDPNATEAELWASEGPRHTLIHEALGHFSDLHSGEDRVVPVPAITTLRAVRSVHRWADVGVPDFVATHSEAFYPRDHKEFMRTGADRPRPNQYFIRLIEIPGRGTLTTIVDNDSPILPFAHRVAKTGFVTDYAATDPAEHYAESVAAALDGIALSSEGAPGHLSVTPASGLFTVHTSPWAHADSPTPVRYGNHRGTHRYTPSPRTSEVVRDRLGADPDVTHTLTFTSPKHDGIRESWQLTSGPLEADRDLFDAAREARLTPIPQDHEFVGIVTPVRFSEDSGLGR